MTFDLGQPRPQAGPLFSHNSLWSLTFNLYESMELWAEQNLTEEQNQPKENRGPAEKWVDPAGSLRPASHLEPLAPAELELGCIQQMCCANWGVPRTPQGLLGNIHGTNGRFPKKMKRAAPRHQRLVDVYTSRFRGRSGSSLLAKSGKALAKS